jgi:hypothetical protein
MLPHIRFSFRYGIQANTKYSPFMVLTKRILTIYNSFNGLCDVFDEHARLKLMAK